MLSLAGGVATAMAEPAPLASGEAGAGIAAPPNNPAARLRRLLGRGLLAGIVLFAFGGAAASMAAGRNRDGKQGRP